MAILIKEIDIDLFSYFFWYIDIPKKYDKFYKHLITKLEPFYYKYFIQTFKIFNDFIYNSKIVLCATHYGDDLISEKLYKQDLQYI